MGFSKGKNIDKFGKTELTFFTKRRIFELFGLYLMEVKVKRLSIASLKTCPDKGVGAPIILLYRLIHTFPINNQQKLTTH